MSKFGKRCHTIGDLVEDRRIDLLFLVVGVPVWEMSFHAEVIDLEGAVPRLAYIPVSVHPDDRQLG